MVILDGANVNIFQDNIFKLLPISHKTASYLTLYLLRFEYCFNFEFSTLSSNLPNTLSVVESDVYAIGVSIQLNFLSFNSIEIIFSRVQLDGVHTIFIFLVCISFFHAWHFIIYLLVYFYSKEIYLRDSFLFGCLKISLLCTT